MNTPEKDRGKRPGRVAELRGIVFQSDARSSIAALFIRPFELLDRWLAGMPWTAGIGSLPNHAAIHVVMDDGQEVVAEQLVGTLGEDLHDGLNWTPIERFRQRDRGGWDVTVPATAFRGVDRAVVENTVDRLNAIEGHPFVGEDCTQFIERAFGGRRLFADSPVLRPLGIGARVADPALPLLRPEARLDPRAERLLHADTARSLRDPLAHVGAPNVRRWMHRLWAVGLGIVIAVVLVLGRPNRWRRASRIYAGIRGVSD